MNKQTSKYRWIVFVSVLLTYLLMASQRTAPGLITDQLMREFAVTASTIGFLTSLQFFMYTFLQIPMGILADRFGPTFLLIIGAALTGVGTIFYSLSTHEFVLFVSRILTGIGDATVWVNVVLILGQWFHKKEFVRLVGIAGMTGSLGFLLATVPFSVWIDFLGWRGAFFSAGLLLCVCSTLLYVVLVKKEKQIFTQASVIKEDVQREKIGMVLSRISLNRQAWALFLCHFGVVGGYIGFISSWAVPYGMNLYDMTRSDASQLTMIGLIGAILGAPLSSWISSQLNTIRKPYLVVHGVVLLSWLTFLLFHGQPPLPLVNFLFFLIGFGFGSSALTFAAVRQTFPLKEAGIVSGFANTGGFLSAVLLPLIFGYLLDYIQVTQGNVRDGYYYGFIAPVLFSAIGLIGLVMFKENSKVH